VYVREIEGRELTFGVSGKLWQDALVMYDHQTRSLWSHVTGNCLEGELEGEEVTVFPSVQTSWEEWKKSYPNTLVLKKPRRTYLSAYKRYNEDPHRLGILGTKNPDDQLDGKDVVLGVRIGSEHQAAYPLKMLKKTPVVNDQLDDEPIVIVYSDKAETAYAYYRRVEDRLLTFRHVADDSILEMTDQQTQSSWNAVTGEAIGGPLAGRKLRRAIGSQAFWFAWRSFFPRTRLWGDED
jgi:hypothetical protein